MKVLVIGHFGKKHMRIGGQTTKTIAIGKLLSSHFGTDNVYELDTGLLTSLKLPWLEVARILGRASVIVMIPGQNALHTLMPFIYLISKFNRAKIAVIPVGGNLANEIQGHFFTKRALRSVQAILPQSEHMAVELRESYSFQNVHIMPNFRQHYTHGAGTTTEDGLKLAYLGRITPDKGIQTLTEAIHRLPEDEKLSVKLDIWGPIEDDYHREFERAIKPLSNIRYRGIMSQTEIGATLPAYDALVAPTVHRTEGIPGSIIDAFTCGITVIASNWLLIPEVVQHRVNGLLFPPRDPNALSQAISLILRDRELLSNLKNNARKAGLQYSPDKALSVFLHAMKLQQP